MTRKPIYLIFAFSFVFALITGSVVTYTQQSRELSSLDSMQSKPQILGISGGGGGGGGISNRPAQMFVYGGENAAGSGGIVSMSSFDEPTISLASYNISGTADVTIYRSSMDAVLKYLIHDKDNLQQNKQVDTSDFEQIATTEHSIKESNEGNILSLPIEGKGVWYVSIQLKNAKVDGFVIRSENGVVAKEGNNKLIYWGQSFKDYKSVDGGSLKIYNLKDGINEIAETKFDKDGMAESDMVKEADLAIYTKGDDISLLPINLQYLNLGSWYSQFAKTVIQNRSFIFTDRPLYQPGDVVNFKAIIRKDDDARYSLPGGTAKITILTGNDETKFEKTFEVSDDGSINGKYELPKNAAVGNYRIVIDKKEEVDYVWGEYFSNALYFNVQKYQKPESYVSVDTPKLEYISGDVAKIQISGNYFSGQPLLDTDIKYKVTATDYYEFAYYSQQERALADSIDTFYGYWYGSQVMGEGVVQLDEKGMAEVEIDTKQLDVPDEEYNYTKGRSKVFVVEVTQEDGSLVPSYSKKNFIVYAGDYGIYQTGQSSSGLVNKTYKLPIKLAPYFRQTSLSDIPLVAKIHRETWVKDTEQLYKYPTYHKEEEDLGEVSVKTSSDGSTTFSFIPTAIGYYKIIVEGRDASDNYISKEFHAYISDHSTPIYQGTEAPEISLTLDQDKYLPTDKALLTIVSEIPDRDMLLTLERGRMDRSQIVHMDGKSQTVELPLKDSDVPNMYISVSSFNKFALDEAEISLPVSADSKKITVKISPENIKYGPGENIKIDITTTDLDGSPQPAEVALWAVDKAIFELADTNLLNIFDTFWNQRGDTTAESHSLRGILANQAEGGGGGGEGRTVFKDTAYWNPQIKTNNEGKATIKFKLPDNLTTWTIAAVASTADTRVGQATKEVVVSKDLVVRPIMPNIMRIGDEIYLSALVQNFTDSDHEFEAQLSFDSGAVEQNTWEKVLINSRSMEQLVWKLTPSKLNDASKIKIIATAKDDSSISDSVEVTIPIRQFGFLEKVGQASIGDKIYNLELDSQIDRDRSSVSLSLSPSLMGTLPTVMNYLVNYVYGCVEQTVSSLVPSILVAENKNLFGDSIKTQNLDKAVDKGLQRLGTMQRGDGGWTWWFTGKSDPYITAYVLEYIQKAEKLGYSVPSEMIKRATQYLENNEQNIQNIVKTDEDTDLLALSVIKEYKNGNHDPESNGLKDLTSRAQSQGDTFFWIAGPKDRFGSIEASTAMALSAIIYAKGDQNIADKAAMYLTRSRKTEYWGNTYATSRVISALIDYAKSSNDLTPNFDYQITLDGKKLANGTIAKAQDTIKDVVVDMSKFKNSSELNIAVSGKGNLYSTLIVSQFLTSPIQDSINRGISISKRFENSKGPDFGIGVGDTVNVYLTVSGLASDDKYGVMTDELPSGMVPVNSGLKNEQNSWNVPEDFETGFNITDTEVTENGVILSLYNVSSTEHIYSYKARVVSAGKFNVPPATVSLMYSPEIYGRTATSQIEITKGLGTNSGQLTNKLIIPWKTIFLIITGIIIIGSSVFVAKKYKHKKELMPPNEA